MNLDLQQPVEMRPHHLERAIRFAIHGTPQDAPMYDILSDAAAADPSATIVFIDNFDVVCASCPSLTGCRAKINDLGQLDAEVAKYLGLEIGRPYRILDILGALQREKEENPRDWFAINHGVEKVPQWRDQVRKLVIDTLEA